METNHLSKIPYRPINCSFHDVLLHLATLKRTAEVVYWHDATTSTALRSRIYDVYTEGAAEFMRLENERIIRLDQLISVDGHLANLEPINDRCRLH